MSLPVNEEFTSANWVEFSELAAGYQQTIELIKTGYVTLSQRWMLTRKICKIFTQVIQEFQTLIQANARIYMLVSAMFQEIPKKHPYDKDMAGQNPQVRDYEVRVLPSCTSNTRA